MSTCAHLVDEHQFEFDDPEFFEVMKALDEWVRTTHASRPTQSDEGEAMARAFEIWVKSTQPELAKRVACDTEIYSIALQQWADEDEEETSDDNSQTTEAGK
jgi:hypothetical protein